MASSPATRLLRWYDEHRRDLPWRARDGERPAPYRVWLSEIMLQQTTVAAVIPYFARFLQRWPDVAALAAAPDMEVMQAWAGLGYYARARNLLACARAIVREHAGAFPDTEAGLRALPGIGAYTAAAIAAIAFSRRAVIVDANVERVVSRLFAIEEPLPSSRPTIRAKTDLLTPTRRAGDFAQAMMDLGATVCTPRNPACMICPIEADCAARMRGDAASWPQRQPKRARPRKQGAVFVLIRPDGAVLVRTRPPRGLLGGMSEFPGEWDLADRPAATFAPAQAQWDFAGAVAHGFTHFELELAVYVGRIGKASTKKAPDLLGGRWILPHDLPLEPFPTLMRKVAVRAGLDLEAISAGGRSAREAARPAHPAGTRSARHRPPSRERRKSGSLQKALAKTLPSGAG
jgi:A/G-specific adenine glycosylase